MTLQQILATRFEKSTSDLVNEVKSLLRQEVGKMRIPKQKLNEDNYEDLLVGVQIIIHNEIIDDVLRVVEGMK